MIVRIDREDQAPTKKVTDCALPSDVVDDGSVHIHVNTSCTVEVLDVPPVVAVVCTAGVPPVAGLEKDPPVVFNVEVEFVAGDPPVARGVVFVFEVPPVSSSNDAPAKLVIPFSNSPAVLPPQAGMRQAIVSAK